MFWQKRDTLPCDALAGVVNGRRSDVEEECYFSESFSFAAKRADGLNILVGELLTRWLWLFDGLNGRRCGVEVGRRHAEGVFAFVPHLHPRWDGAVSDLKRHAMCGSALAVDFQLSAVFVTPSAPHGATVLIR